MLSTVSPDVFLDSCFENCTESFTSLNQLCDVFDDLSLADTFVPAASTTGNSLDSNGIFSSGRNFDRGNTGSHKAVVQRNFGQASGEMKALLGVTAFMYHHKLSPSEEPAFPHRMRFKSVWPSVVRRCKYSRQAMASLVSQLVPEDCFSDPTDVEDIEDDDDVDDGDDVLVVQTPDKKSEASSSSQASGESQPSDGTDYTWLPSSATSMLEVYPFAVHLPGTTVFAYCRNVCDAIQPRTTISFLDF